MSKNKNQLREDMDTLAFSVGIIHGSLTRDDVIECLSERGIDKKEIDELVGKIKHFSRAFYWEAPKND